MLIGIVAVVPILLAGLSYAWLRRRRAMQPAPLVFRCPSCSQQIRYSPAQVGAKGHCPRCWKPVAPPRMPEPIADSTRVVRLQRPRFGRLTATARR